MTHPNSAAEFTLGTLGAVCWSVQLVPQIWKSWRTKDTEGLSGLLMAFWWAGGVFLGAYNVLTGVNIPLIVQPQCLSALTAISWSQTLKYSHGRSAAFSFIFCFLLYVVGAGVETGLIYGGRAAKSRGHNQVERMAGVVSAILITVALVPQYIEIYRYRAVIGISLPFLFIDLMGGIFSILSLIFAKGSFNIIAAVPYGLVVLMEIGVFVCAGLLNPGYYRRKAKEEEGALEGEDVERQERAVEQ